MSERSRSLAAGLVLMGCAFSSASFAQTTTSSIGVVSKGTVRVAASKRYDKGRVHQFLFGGGYRALWKQEVELPVLDIAKTGGGLTPTGRFGGLQTAVLGFKGKDGKAYSFRGTDKDPAAVLPAVLRDTFVRALVQDQMAAQHPAGPVPASVISEAAGVLTIKETLVVMPDDPALGKYREEFAGMVGSIYVYPLPAKNGRGGFHGATEIINQKKLYARLERGNQDRVWTEAFLRARLIDILLGDFDRHRKQWRWAKLPGEPRWQPIPEDRDQAFVRYDGFGTRMAYVYLPILQCYGPEYPFISGLTLHGWEQDRWLLADQEWSQWEAVVKDIQSRLSEEVLDRAINAMPKEFVELDGARLRKDIKGRRDTLEQGARAFYEHLAGQVNVQTSSAAEKVSIEWNEDGSLSVLVHDLKNPERELFSRRFIPGETKDVRVYLRAGDDQVTVQGDPGRRIDLRVIADGGNKSIDASKSGGLTIYDEKKSAKIKEGTRTSVVDEVFEKPPPDSGFVDVEDVPARDWGSGMLPVPNFGYERDVGFVFGLGAMHTVYGFRKHPYAARYRVDAAFATEALQPLFSASASFYPENSKLLFEINGRYSGIEIVRFYGFGNETDRGADDAFFRVRNQQVAFSAMMGRAFWDNAFRISGGLWYGHSTTRPGDRLIDRLDPFGAGAFGSVGGVVNLRLDTRSSIKQEGALSLPLHSNPAAGYPTKGFLIDLKAKLSPPILDATGVYGSVEGSVAGFISFFDKGRLALSLRAGGVYTFGDVPYFAAAYIGGGRAFSGDASVRGLRAQRFAGDASVYGNADVRLFLFRANLGLPVEIGLFGFGDVGRVFLEDESSNKWHPSGGGGIWFAPLARTNTISTSIAVSEEAVLFYLRAGFHY